MKRRRLLFDAAIISGHQCHVVLVDSHVSVVVMMMIIVVNNHAFELVALRIPRRIPLAQELPPRSEKMYTYRLLWM